MRSACRSASPGSSVAWSGFDPAATWRWVVFGAGLMYLSRRWRSLRRGSWVVPAGAGFVREVAMRIAIATAVLSILSGPAPAPAVEPDGPQVVAKDFIRAWNAHDTKALAELFTEDADYVNVGGNWWKGRHVIQTMHERLHANRATGTLVETNTAVRMLRPDVSVLHFQWELSGARDANGILVPTRHGIMQIIAVMQAGGWRIASAQNGDVRPSE
jgi:uncharacterized protein (TIGR02246 family)